MSVNREAPPEPGEPDARDAFGLTARERAILDLEKRWYRYAGVKENEIREQFGVSATRYYQILNALIDTPEALRAEPQLVHRLQRLRASRRAQCEPRSRGAGGSGLN